MAASLAKLSAFTKDGDVNVVVESPRGSRLKLEYDARRRTFKAGRPLPVGLAYPFDWGFIAGTRAPDGDPVDAMVLNDVATYPGIVMECRVLGMVEVVERPANADDERTNPCIIVVPTWTAMSSGSLSKSFKAQLAQFFIGAASNTGKEVRVAGWGSARQATDYVRAHLR